MKDRKRKLELDHGCLKNLKVSVHHGSVPLQFAMLVDEVTKNARKGWTKQILNAEDLVLIPQSH